MGSELAITVASLLAEQPDTSGLALELLAGRTGLDRLITTPYVQKTGLALAGFQEYLMPGRVLIFGHSELRYLESLDEVARARTAETTFAKDIPCLLVTDGLTPPAELVLAAESLGRPLLRTSLGTPTAIAKLSSFLEDSLSERTIIHGVLMDVLGLGVLIVGDSGIGKSECALDLIVRGHRLVADDAVEVRLRGETDLVGSCPALTRHHMELRGIGLINVMELFGVASIRAYKLVELVVRLERWDPACEYERLGLDDQTYEILGLRTPFVLMPVAPGRNLANLVEVAARNQLLRARGHHSARVVAERLEEVLRETASPDRATDVVDDTGREGPK